VDARRPLSRVLSDYLEDRLANFFGDPASPGLFANSGDQFPIQTEPRPAPMDNNFGRDDNVARGSGQAFIPPSTVKFAPVMYEDSGPATNATIAAISSTRP